MDKYRIEAYCKKPDCFKKTITAVVPLLKPILKKLKMPDPNSYELPERQKLVDKLKVEFSSLELKLRNVETDVKDDFDMDTMVDGAIIYSKDEATTIQLNWDNPERIDATVCFDSTHNHPYEEYLKLKKIMRKLDFHILKPLEY